ncbi:unnamed protein product, partial [Closterium sp. NIES-53]
NVPIFDLDFDAILAAMYALADITEGDCYLRVPLDPGTVAAALGASAAAALGASASAAPGAGPSPLSGTAPTESFHTFRLDSGASRSFVRDSTTLTPLSRPIAVSLADPSGSPVLAHSSTVLPCPATPSGLLSGLHLPSFSTNLVSGADLQDAWVDQFTPGGQRVTHCTCSRTCRHLATQVFAAASRSSPASAPCSCRPLAHETLLWHHHLGHPSLHCLRGMASRALVSGLPRSLPPLPPGPAPTCVPCVEGRQRAAPHSSSFPPTEAPLQTLHMDVWGPARVRGQGHERYFLLVIDDNSRYTTVFPLRSKGEGIRQTFTLPASPQRNGIAERRIGMVMDVAPFVRDLFVDKLSSRAVACVFLGFPPDAPGWQFYHPTSRRVLSPQDVTFDESVPYYRLFPYRAAPSPPRRSSSRLFHPPVDPLPPQGPAPSGVSQVDAVEPVEVAVDSGTSGGAELERVEPWGAESGRAEPERRAAGAGCAAAAGGSTAAGGAGATGPGGARTGGTGAAGPGGATGAGATDGAGAGSAAGVGAAGGTGAGAAEYSGGLAGAGAARGTGAGGAAGAGAPVGAGVGATGAAGGALGAGGAAGVGAYAGGAGAVPAGSGGAARPRPYFVLLLEQVLGLSPSPGPAPSLECPPPVQSESQLQLASPLPAPSPYAGPTGGLADRRELESRPASPVRPARTSRRVPRQRPPAVPGTHQMALRPSTASQRVPLPSPPASSLPALPDPESDSLRAASPALTRFLATVVTDPSFESTAASALVAELLDFAAHCRLDYAASLVAESASVCPPSHGGECALSTDVLEDRQEEFQCFAAALPHLVSILLAPEGDPDAPDILTSRSYAEAIEGPYSSQWQAAMDAEMASWQSTGTYVDEVPPPGANIVSGMWIFRVKRSRVLRLTSRRVTWLEHDYELHSLDFSTAFLQGSLHEEIWLRHPPGFTGSFPPGTQWSLRRPVYGLRQAPREWHDTLRTTLAALGFAPSIADPSLFLRTDTLLLPFYILVYVLQRFDFTYSSPQATPLSTRHSLSALPSDESVESSGPYPELVGCLVYLMTCTRPDLAYPLSILARYVAPGRHRPEHMAAAKRVLRYLCSTSGIGLVLGGRSPVVLTGHADASWADDQATQRSSQGYTFSLGSGSVSWWSTRSSSVLISSCEAEIYASAMAAQE